MPEGQVAQVILHYDREYNGMCGISMVDRKGNTLFKTYDHPRVDALHTISLEEGESIVGFRSCVYGGGKIARHADFQFMIAKEVFEFEESDEEEKSDKFKQDEKGNNLHK